MAAHRQKGAADHAHIVLIDESGVLLSPLVRRTLAPRGQTPLLTVRHAHRQKLSIIGAISLSPIRHQPGLYFQTLPNDYVDSQFAAFFVRELVQHLRGKVIVVWDNGPMHKGEPIRQLLAAYPRLSIEYLPPYAPELNPVEYLWSHVKFAELANYVPLDVAALDQQVVQILNNAKQDRVRLRSFYKGTPLVTETRIT